MVKSALIFANGAVDDGDFVQQEIASASDALVIAADGGARMAMDHYKLLPDIVIGDMDSLTDEELATIRAKNIPLKQYPDEKNETDLELALLWTVEQGITRIRVIGALGRRIDQTIANIYLLAMKQLTGLDVQLVSGNQRMWLAHPGEYTLTGNVGDTISLIPISGDVTHITTTGLYYPLNNENLRFGPARGVSNVLDAENATVRFESGLLLVVQSQGTPE